MRKRKMMRMRNTKEDVEAELSRMMVEGVELKGSD